MAAQQPWACSLCGSPNRGEDTFCTGCGARKEAEWTCYLCGQGNPADYTFCVRCGAKRSYPTTPTPRVPTGPNLQDLVAKAIAKAEESLSSPERQERMSSMDEATKKRVIGYLKAEESKRAKITAVTTRFGLSPIRVEDIIYEAIADGKLEGYIDDKTQEFVLVTRAEVEAAKPGAVIHVGGDYIAGSSVRDSVVVRSSLGEKASKKCKSCNSDIPAKSDFCPECGSRT